ncbi:hypothetical protein FS842_006201, partial [Serendipita sp. 407]
MFLTPTLMDSLHDIVPIHETAMYTPITPNQIRLSPLPDPEQSPIRQVLYPESTRRSLPFGVQGSDVVDCQRRDVSMGMAPSYGGFYPIEPNSMYTSSAMRWKAEEPSATTPNPFASLDHSSGSTAAFPVFSD